MLLMAAQDQQVRLFIFDCVSTTSTNRHNLDIGNNAPVFPERAQSCPPGEAVVGIRIRHGQYVNAVGLICDTFKQIVLRDPEQPAIACSGEGDQVPKEWNEMLAAHNDRRKEHCVPALKWCQSLADSAQNYAGKCILNKHGNPQGTGENMASAWAEAMAIPFCLPSRTEMSWRCGIANGQTMISTIQK
jgi:hypothetical protein